VLTVRFYQFIRDHAGPRMRWILFTSVTSGLFMGITMAVIGHAVNEFVTEGSVSARSCLLFILGATSYYWTLLLAARASTGAAFEAVSELQLRLADKLRHSRFLEFQELDRGYVYSTLAGSKDIVIEASRHLTMCLSGAAMLIGAFAYGATVSLIGAAVIGGVLAACGYFLQRFQHRGLLLEEQTATANREFLASIKDLVGGFAELKIHRPKREDFYTNHVLVLAARNRAARELVEALHAKGMAFFSAYALLPMGAVVYLLPRLLNVSAEQVVVLLAVAFFSLTPTVAFVTFISLSSRACLTLSTLQDFENQLDALCDAESASAPTPPAFERIEIPDGLFRYHEGFSLHIERFELRRGELAMLAGGNGSGKTTLMRVLAGLYPLASGDILVDGRPVREIGLENYRSLCSVIFTDFHLFDTLWGIENPDPDRLRTMIDEMGLGGKLVVDDRRFSTVDLSSGQRKRLAVLCAVIEDRPVLLFDEVAAGFDVRYREYFYRTLLPALRAEGRTILAISHDDRYFDVADRVLTMREGTLDGAGPGAAAHTAA
jgi:putative ATP-binding cassette transporter